MRYTKLRKENFHEFLRVLERYGKVYAPHRISEKFYDFREMRDPNDVVTEYPRTVMPPKKFFFEPLSELFKVGLRDFSYSTPEEDIQPFVIFGVHAYDIKGLMILDSVYMEPGLEEKQYAVRRQKALIVGISDMPDQYNFSNVRNADWVDEGFDLFLHPIEEGWLIRVGSPTGHKIIDDNSQLFHGTTLKDIDDFKEHEKRRQLSFPMCMSLSDVRYVLEVNWNNPIWEEEAKKCLGCGNCTMTCPTCRCYEVWDEPDVELSSASRFRRWDSCQFHDHGLVAGGENFREHKVDRFRHRYNCKNSYVKALHCDFCVGCGRCTAFCPAGISYMGIITHLMEAKVHED